MVEKTNQWRQKIIMVQALWQSDNWVYFVYYGLYPRENTWTTLESVLITKSEQLRY